MTIPPLQFQDYEKGKKSYEVLSSLIKEIENHQITGESTEKIEQELAALNQTFEDGKKERKAIKKASYRIARFLVSKEKLTPKGYYRNMWMSIGMSAFGIPMGVAFGLSMDNLGLLGVGIPIGLAIGVAVGVAMDNQAKEKGRQLNTQIEI